MQADAHGSMLHAKCWLNISNHCEFYVWNRQQFYIYQHSHFYVSQLTQWRIWSHNDVMVRSWYTVGATIIRIHKVFPCKRVIQDWELWYNKTRQIIKNMILSQGLELKLYLLWRTTISASRFYNRDEKKYANLCSHYLPQHKSCMTCLHGKTLNNCGTHCTHICLTWILHCNIILKLHT